MKRAKMPDGGILSRRAVWIVAAITLARAVALWFGRTDLFVDESQYWLWGQNLDLGYYSKPPLIAWVIRAVTEVAGSDAPFWVRLPGPIFHGATALILGALAARLFSGRAAFWVAVTYATLPFAALGSLLISTDTIMAPFFAAALLFHFRTIAHGRAGAAAVAGVAVGLAFLAKYAAVYFFVGAALAALFVPSARISAGNTAILLGAFAVTVAPNIAWNVANDLTTLEHTMDNVGWVRDDGWLGGLNPAGLTEFVLSQFAVFGPVLFAALLVGYLRPGSERMRALVFLSVPALLTVCVQALLDKAYANWAVAAYFAGTLIVVPLLLDRAPRALWLSLAINGAVAVLLPLLTLIAPAPVRDGKPLLARYLGRADLSREIIAAARETGGQTIVARDRDILADLFYTGRGMGLAIHAPKPAGRPQNYYEQIYPLPDSAGQVLLIADRAPDCGSGEVSATRRFDAERGAYAGRDIAAYLIPSDCANARP
ncbi:ArnT family glycosyltransferase [Defluviimonas sp. SAOS-178_SWC]|uniref:ArnT family glycosyltransferase n=1 Tax=Defluviimonas sp. SAOS-178_SWC TaxID=3121287 RepID=UPI003221AB73